ncbi:hypothetical protein BRARA_A01232 [Brassica rapa]|uniref:GRF-like zinc ribbon domain-containing protein n=1 Tax=Brassica campestris TaxID=3711 RepID=A0A398AT20_BRACM|nr:hypothetical protein BRARA_A01232 [Brassica rapa]
MATSFSASSDATSFGLADAPKNDGPLCRCGRPTTITISWSEANPGRRYYRCDVHTFVGWADHDDPCGWQTASLSEARDIIHRQRDEIRQLKAVNRKILRDRESVQENQASSLDSQGPFDENAKLRLELAEAAGREKLYRQCFAISWAGFFVATAIIASTVFK